MEFDLIALINQYFDTTLMITVPFLMFLGKQLKLSKRIDDTMIVNILCYIGIVVAVVYNCVTKLPELPLEWFMLFMSSVLNGLVLAYTSVGVHQQFKQHKENQANKLDI